MVVKKKVASKKAAPKKAAPKKAAKKSLDEKVEKISIPALDIKMCKITIKGVSPLMVNRFDEKCRQEIEDTYRGKARNKKIPISPEEEYDNSIYYIEKARGRKKSVYGVPASGIKNAAVSACRFVEKVPMTLATGAFHVMSGPNGLVPIMTKTGPVMDERGVRVGNFGNKKPAMRRRARFDDWAVEFLVRYNSSVMSQSTLLNLFENAGFSVGLCEFRPEKKGDLGMFTVARA